MDTARQARVAFYLTGKRPGAELEPVAGMDLTPALLAAYRDLTRLRYDYPLVLREDADMSACARPLSALVDEALRESARDDDDERFSRRVLRLEELVRKAAAAGPPRTLSELWAEAAEQMGAADDDGLREDLDRAAGAAGTEGIVCDCDAGLPSRLFFHLWRTAQRDKSARLERGLASRIQKLTDILRADTARSKEGRSPECLQAAIGGLDAEAFDFQAMSRVLVRTANQTTLTETRRQRLEALIGALGRYRFTPETFFFKSCVEALKAWQDRFGVLVEVARAIAMAELEIAGDYREDRHDVFFDEYGADGLAPEDLALFADYLVCVNASAMDASEQAALMELLSSGLPVKILIQTDDVLEAAMHGPGQQGFGRSALHFANMALGLNEVYVLQSPASALPQMSHTIAEGMKYPGTAIFSVFSGASPSAVGLPPYLLSAAAAESRAFPIFVYDPSAGPDMASRFSLAGNPQPEEDWPKHPLNYEDADRRGVSDTVAFTFADFASLDERFARHLARVPAAGWDEAMIPVSAALAGEAEPDPERVPCIQMVDRLDRLQHVLVDEKLLREARRCREAWHNLQELGGIHNSYAERLLAEGRLAPEMDTDVAAGTSTEPDKETAAPTVPEPETVVEGESEPSPDEAYIETARCTTCNECTQINDKMFAYDDNRQAYIADRTAGTYAQLVEAAESCQVSIIHPGKPLDPDEPGLDELMKRAEPFI